MQKENLFENYIKSYVDFPKKGILFRDISPILEEPKIFKKLICNMSSADFFKTADCIIGVDARGFIFGSAIAINIEKPLIMARKPGKLPGDLSEKSYDLEYGNNSLSIQKNLLLKYKNFAIVDDLLATGGTVDCISRILKEANKNIVGLSVVIELEFLKGREKFSAPVSSELIF